MPPVCTSAEELCACPADRIIFAVAANISIASLNLSLMVNTVGFYQIAKLLIVPFTAVVQSVWLKESLSVPQMACTAVVLCGVAVVYAASSAPCFWHICCIFGGFGTRCQTKEREMWLHGLHAMCKKGLGPQLTKNVRACVW
jgi:multidrug transporter EmrE-like cation transporter